MTFIINLTLKRLNSLNYSKYEINSVNSVLYYMTFEINVGLIKHNWHAACKFETPVSNNIALHKFDFLLR